MAICAKKRGGNEKRTFRGKNEGGERIKEENSIKNGEKGLKIASF